MIMETFFLVEEKRAIRTLFFQDLFFDQVLCAGCARCDGMAAW
jgi:hypothetical protein